MIRVELDKYRCKFCGACQEIAPDTFQVDTDAEEINVIEDADTDPELLRQAAAWCPAHCIEIVE